MWFVLFAIFLLLIIVLLYRNDNKEREIARQWKDRAQNIAADYAPGIVSRPTVDSSMIPKVGPTVQTVQTVQTIQTAPTIGPVTTEPKKEGFNPKMMHMHGFGYAGR